jgi:hypothetical protein
VKQPQDIHFEDRTSSRHRGILVFIGKATQDIPVFNPSPRLRLKMNRMNKSVMELLERKGRFKSSHSNSGQRFLRSQPAKTWKIWNKRCFNPKLLKYEKKQSSAEHLQETAGTRDVRQLFYTMMKSLSHKFKWSVISSNHSTQ